jgi:hypothetical protein
MADPILPGVIRSQVVFQGKSGLPEDQWVNTFAFTTGTVAEPTQAMYDSIVGRLTAFYAAARNIPNNGAIALSSQMSKNIAPTVQIKSYWLGQAPPREPITAEFQIAVGQGEPLPSEVSLCASFYATRNLPRQRGRIFVGPLGQAAATNLGDVSRPSSAMIELLWKASQDLANVTDQGVLLAILSGADIAARRVTAGWVDNAWDTQRRRGEDASARVQWEATPPLP